MNNSSPSQNRALTVSELNRQAKSLLESSFMMLHVQGELSNFVRASSGHWYFTLKDERAQVRCAMFRNRNRYLTYTPTNGDQVVLRAKVSLYEGRGDFQLIGEFMEAAGTGALQQAFEQLKHKLSQEGLFDPALKRPLPRPCQHIGVVTSPTGAAIHDILTVLKRRFPAMPVTLYPAAVQGEAAPLQIVRAIQQAQKHGKADVLIVGRGGGSLEDLWAFNDERVARTIRACPIPVVSAVGHEVDFTISDFIADLRAPTPSAAAELLSPDQLELRQRLQQARQRLNQQLNMRLIRKREQLEQVRLRLKHPGERLRERAQRLDDLELRLRRALQQRLDNARTRQQTLQARLERCRPDHTLQRQRQYLAQLEQQLERNIAHKLSQSRQRWRAAAAQLHTVSPLATLERGYAIVEKEDQVIRTSDELHQNDQVDIRLGKGRISARVVNVKAD